MKKQFLAPKTAYRDLAKHETKSHALRKFLLVAAVFVGYFAFIAEKYGAAAGFSVAALTWSFFVLCTPVADAGFLLDFPLRLILRWRMFFTEILVWVLAAGLNFWAFFAAPEIYEKTKILILFRHILAQPVPFWGIILISAVGTFFSVKFGDELLDKVRHSQREIHKKHKHDFRLVVMIFVFALSLIFYDFLLKKLGVDLPI